LAIGLQITLIFVQYIKINFLIIGYRIFEIDFTRFSMSSKLQRLLSVITTPVYAAVENSQSARRRMRDSPQTGCARRM